MGLSSLEIYKKLPQTNCGDCGHPTCMAFGMQLAEGKAELDECPDVSDEARQALAAAAAPPITDITIGTGDYERTLGEETELFRHDKTFFNETGVAISVSDADDAEAIEERVEEIDQLTFERVGQVIEVDMIAVTNDSNDADSFKEAVEVTADNTDRTLILVSEDVEAIENALEVVADRNPLIYAATENNYEEMTELAEENECPLTVKGEDLNNLAEVSKKVKDLDYENLVIDSGARNASQVLADQNVIRRKCINDKFRPFAFPTITFTSGETPAQEIAQASTYIAKYAGIVVLSEAIELAELLPVLTVRQNIYNDPRVPVTVEPNEVYEVGEPDEESPVIITTNFSLTYYSVEGEIPASAYIIPIDTDGTSLLTAWAADKFGGKKIAEIVNEETDIGDKVDHNKLLISGHVAVISGKLEEESGWDVVVGPREASGITNFIANRWEEELEA